jgi:hypothetical protein
MHLIAQTGGLHFQRIQYNVVSVKMINALEDFKTTSPVPVAHD